MGVQIHGGMGFIEETGAAQYYRDARILPIYEGTNGIQAIDLVARKLPLGRRRGGEGVSRRDARHRARGAGRQPPRVRPHGRADGGDADRAGRGDAVDGRGVGEDSDEALAGATPYLRLFGLAAGGHYLARARWRRAQVETMEQIAWPWRGSSPRTSRRGPGLAASVMSGAGSSWPPARAAGG